MDMQLENLFLKRQILELQGQLLQMQYKEISASLEALQKKEAPTEPQSELPLES
jgi:ABC-type phosphate transport system auxiliary subunit